MSEPSGSRYAVEVVIPLRWPAPKPAAPTDGADPAIAELTAYLRWLGARADVTVVDGSEPAGVHAHTRAWTPHVRLVPPDGRPGANGKVVGALTGIAASRHERVVLADDDVRYDERSLGQVLAALDTADLVRPQNVFTDWPWHARWDASRSLVARAFGADWPGTFGLRATGVRQMGGWGRDVLFENLDMVRTAQAAGLRVRNAPHIVVGRRPPSAAHFWSQRVRQAYDDFAQPGRLLVELAILPAVLVALWRRPSALLVAAAALVVLAETGRRRFTPLQLPRDVPLWAPLWAMERGVCVWLALGARVTGGLRYNGRRLARAARRPA